MFLTSRLRPLQAYCQQGKKSINQSWNSFTDYYRTILEARFLHTKTSKDDQALCHTTEESTNSSLSDPVQASSYSYYSQRMINNGTHDLKKFLEVGSDPRESRYWLKQFKRMTDDGHPFAVIQLDGDVIDDELMLEQFASSVAFLHRNAMHCIIVLGTGGDLEKGDGDRNLNLQKLKISVNRNMAKLVTSMEKHHIPVRPLFGGSFVFQTDSENNSTITNINRDLVDWCMKSSFIPVITAQGETPSGQLSLLEPMYACEELAKVFTPLKVMYLNKDGGLRDKEGSVVSNVNLPLDLTEPETWPWGGQESWDRIQRIYDLLKDLPTQSSVVSMSADSILAELFTHGGSGTFFKISEPIHTYTSFERVDKTRLLNLINHSFNKQLKQDYFEEKQDKLNTLYLSEKYSSAAIITNEPGLDIPYLDKFVVGTEAQGLGTSEMIWSQIRADFPALFWRSKKTNKINPWYFKKCDGSYVNEEWIVFWYGIGHSRGSQIIDFAVALEQSFHESGKKECATHS